MNAVSSGGKHAADIKLAQRPRDCFGYSARDMCELHQCIRPPAKSPGIMRTSGVRVVIGSHRKGARAEMLGEELKQLRIDAQLFATSCHEPWQWLLLIAAYHLRFENIHPFSDGNGRVGRLIAAEQIRQSFRFPVGETFRRMAGTRDDYQRALSPIGRDQAVAKLVRYFATLIDFQVLEPQANLVAPFRLTPIFG